MNMKKKSSLFIIGILILSITVFLEHLWLGETNATCFLKGVACGLEVVGAIVFLLDQRKEG